MYNSETRSAFKALYCCRNWGKYWQNKQLKYCLETNKICGCAYLLVLTIIFRWKKISCKDVPFQKISLELYHLQRAMTLYNINIQSERRNSSNMRFQHGVNNVMVHNYFSFLTVMIVKEKYILIACTIIIKPV